MLSELSPVQVHCFQMSKLLYSMRPSVECVRKELEQLLECPKDPLGGLSAVLRPVSQDVGMMRV